VQLTAATSPNETFIQKLTVIACGPKRTLQRRNLAAVRLAPDDFWTNDTLVVQQQVEALVWCRCDKALGNLMELLFSHRKLVFA
jgi:hypothetical protein